MSELLRPTREQFDQLCSKVSDQMRDYAYPYIASISRELEPNVGDI